eukprot:3590222-Ditylum_brightwellii.AAC.1
MSTKIKLFQSATEPLLIIFDTTSKQVNLFCEALKDRAEKSGWELIGGNVTTITDHNVMTCNLIMEYGRLTSEDIKAQVMVFIGSQTRQTQNYVQLYYFLKNSLVETAKLKILAKTTEYIVNSHPSRELLFKILMKKAVMDTQATASHLRENLTNLDNDMSAINSNIHLFNQHVKSNQEGIKAQGESTDDLMINLFEVYLVVSDGNFMRYMCTKKDDYNDGADIEPNKLMSNALNKYNILVQQ